MKFEFDSELASILGVTVIATLGMLALFVDMSNVGFFH